LPAAVRVQAFAFRAILIRAYNTVLELWRVGADSVAWERQTEQLRQQLMTVMVLGYQKSSIEEQVAALLAAMAAENAAANIFLFQGRAATACPVPLDLDEELRSRPQCGSCRLYLVQPGDELKTRCVGYKERLRLKSARLASGELVDRNVGGLIWEWLSLRSGGDSGLWRPLRKGHILLKHADYASKIPSGQNSRLAGSLVGGGSVGSGL
jgi:hypothetical protein